MFRNPTTDSPLANALTQLASALVGELHTDDTWRILYATDASAYREMPLAVALPKTEADVAALIRWANAHSVALIPRTAGTSLAGQVVGSGLVVDMSKYFTQILEINPQEHWVRVQPGVIRDELNRALKPHGLFFGPETSTANRAMIGGMVGNNSCGTHSPVYGSTREHTLEVKGFLSDGSPVSFGALSATDFAHKTQADTLEGRIYQGLYQLLGPAEVQEEIRREFPHPGVTRRNTGYALDFLISRQPFAPEGEAFNMCKLICGSEGTLMFITEIKLNLSPLPPPEIGLVCIHCHSVDESLRANVIAMQHRPTASELMDHYVLECTKSNIEQRQNRFFVEGDPAAILVVEFAKDTREEIDQAAQALIAELQAAGLGYHYPMVYGADSVKVWNLRKAGLGLLSNMVGDAKPAPVIEDTAVSVEELPAYIAEFNEVLAKYGRYAVHYAHAGDGELHLRPILDLKTAEGHREFRAIAEDVAALVKKYRGSLSGEHGDGRLRAEFIRQMVGERNYELMRQVKQLFDPQNRFNPHKIVDAPPMDTSLRYTPGQVTREVQTVFDFSEVGGLVRAAEFCNGSGDCRKTHLSGGTMCPSYMATREEKDTTRARANILREVLTQSQAANPLADERIKEVMDLCLSCKGCKSECPSNVDVAKMKAEFLQHYYDQHGVPLRTRVIANFTRANRLAALSPKLYNLFVGSKLSALAFKRLAGFAPERSLPQLHTHTLRQWYKRHYQAPAKPQGVLYLFCDEFTNYNDTPIGITTIRLLTGLGYEVKLLQHAESGRTYLSKGLLRQAKQLAKQNVQTFAPLVNADSPLVGIEPSALLSFRDEYLDLADADWKPQAQALAQHCYTLEEFLAKERDAGRIRPEQFSTDKKLVKVHGHCHQKALSSMTPTKKILTLPLNYEVHMIPSGCCGMAGSFGYEAEHYALSMQVGELVLFPTVRQQAPETLICAVGTSCRHQIKDGTKRQALHPAEILWEALRK